MKGCGRYIPRQPYSDIVYSRIQQRDKVNWWQKKKHYYSSKLMARMHDIKFDLYAITCTCTCVCVQVCQPQKVEREPYTGPVIEIPSSK